MFYRTALVSSLLALAEARFNQEQLPIGAISAVQGGDPGVAATIAGAAVSDLLAATNACNKLKRGDEILAKLGNGDDAIAAAIGMVVAEKNVNPFNSQTPVVCSDPSLPTSEILRGRTPLVDPDFDDADIANALSAQTKANPIDATGKSILDLLLEAGVKNVAGQAADGAAAAAPAAPANNAANENENQNENQGQEQEQNVDNGNANENENENQVQEPCPPPAAGNNGKGNENAGGKKKNKGKKGKGKGKGKKGKGKGKKKNKGKGKGKGKGKAVNEEPCDNQNQQNENQQNENQQQEQEQQQEQQQQENANEGENANQGGNGNVQQSTVAGADFGLCVPTMKFEGGIGNRPDTEFTFLPIDPLCAQGQQEALNPNIITNRICDQLTNVCQANQAAKDLCRSAQDAVEALGTRDKSTADKWNELLGFAGAITNPDGGPADRPAAGAARKHRRSFRA